MLSDLLNSEICPHYTKSVAATPQPVTIGEEPSWTQSYNARVTTSGYWLSATDKKAFAACRVDLTGITISYHRGGGFGKEKAQIRNMGGRYLRTA